jgi:membrane protein
LFFSLIPVVAVFVGVLGFVYGSAQAQRELVGIIRDIYPSATAEEVRIARELVDGRALSLGLGIIGTLLAAGALFSSIDSAIRFVLGSGRRRSFFRGRLDGIALVAAMLLVAFLSFALSYGAQTAQGFLTTAGYGPGARLAIAIGSPLVGLAAGWSFFYLIYRYIPRVAVPEPVARTAALVSAVLWEVAKVAFGYYTRAIGEFSTFGPIAFAAGLLTWVYFTAVIILIGTEILKLRVRTNG